MRAAFEMAVANIAKWGDTDVFPLPMDNHVIHDKPAETVAILESIHGDFQRRLGTQGPANQSSLALVGYTGFRWATQIDPIWNAYLLGLVLSVASQIEAERVPRDRETVFSYRYQPDGSSSSLFAKDAWAAFTARSRLLSDQHPFVLTCDISDFYSRIYHHRLENALNFAVRNSETPSRIMTLLTSMSATTSYGLPVGGPAARILSELLLNRTDRLLLSKGLTFTRFADDYHIFVESRGQAFAALQLLSETLYRNEGLSLQKSKTRILPADEFRQSAIFMGEEDSTATPATRRFITLSLRFDPYSPTAESDYEILRAQIDQYDITGMLAREIGKSRVNPALTRRLVRALQFLDPPVRDNAVVSLMDSLDVLAPVFPTVMRTVRDLLPDLGAQARDHVGASLLRLLEDQSYLLGVEINLAYALRVLALIPSEAAEQHLVRLYDSVTGEFVRRDIVLTMGRWGARYWLSDRKNYFGQLHPWVKRALIVASYALGDEGKHWRRAISRSLVPFDALTAAWASERVQEPGWTIPV